MLPPSQPLYLKQYKARDWEIATASYEWNLACALAYRFRAWGVQLYIRMQSPQLVCPGHGACGRPRPTIPPLHWLWSMPPAASLLPSLLTDSPCLRLLSQPVQKAGWSELKWPLRILSLFLHVQHPEASNGHKVYRTDYHGIPLRRGWYLLTGRQLMEPPAGLGRCLLGQLTPLLLHLSQELQDMHAKSHRSPI